MAIVLDFPAVAVRTWIQIAPELRRSLEREGVPEGAIPTALERIKGAHVCVVELLTVLEAAGIDPQSPELIDSLGALFTRQVTAEALLAEAYLSLAVGRT